MKTIVITEKTIPAAELPAYVGWTLNAVRRTDGVLAWNRLESAELTTDGYVNIVHPRAVKAYPGAPWQSVPEGALVATVDPLGRPHMVTVSRGDAVDA